MGALILLDAGNSIQRRRLYRRMSGQVCAEDLEVEANGPHIGSLRKRAEVIPARCDELVDGHAILLFRHHLTAADDHRTRNDAPGLWSRPVVRVGESSRDLEHAVLPGRDIVELL